MRPQVAYRVCLSGGDRNMDHPRGHYNKLGIALVFLLGCLGSPGQNTSNTSTFAAIRESVRETIQGKREFKLLQNEAYDLYLCNEAAQLGMSDDAPLGFATAVALHIEIYQAELTRLRVPESIWRPQLVALDQFGARSIQRFTGQLRSYEQLDKDLREIEKTLADSVIAYGRGSPRLPQFTWEGGCGAGEQEVEITTTPRGAMVSYISLFQYKLCEARNVNPEDPARCDGWISAVKVFEDMIGKYHYIATWPDGHQAKGIFDITGKATVNIPR
jgi:hypothetical protein